MGPKHRNFHLKSRFGQPFGVGPRAGGLFWHLSWDDVGPLPGGDRWPGVARDVEALDARDLALDGGAVLYLHCLYGLCVAATGFRDIKKTRKKGDLGCFLGVGSSINGDSTDKHGWFAGYFAGYFAGWFGSWLAGWLTPKNIVVTGEDEAVKHGIWGYQWVPYAAWLPYVQSQTERDWSIWVRSSSREHEIYQFRWEMLPVLQNSSRLVVGRATK